MGKGDGHAVRVAVAVLTDGHLAADVLDMVVGSKKSMTRVVMDSIDLRCERRRPSIVPRVTTATKGERARTVDSVGQGTARRCTATEDVRNARKNREKPD